MPNETTRLERAIEYCNTKIYGTHPSTKNLAQFADQECAALEKEIKEEADLRLSAMETLAKVNLWMAKRDVQIESFTKHVRQPVKNASLIIKKRRPN
jgi:hypothetical protein